MELLLFNIYTDDFPVLISSHSDAIMFADDTSILISNINHYEPNLNFKSLPNQLILHIQKTSLVKFAPTKSSLNLLHLS